MIKLVKALWGLSLREVKVFVRVEGWSFGGSMDCIY